MKKRVFSLVLALLVCAVLIPAPEAHAAPNTINVYNWGQYISDGTDGYIDINAAFEEATGIHVNYMTFDSNETMYTKLKTGGSSYDVIIPSDYMVGRLIDEGLLLPLNFDNIPNYKYMDEAYKTSTPFRIPGAPSALSTTAPMWTKRTSAAGIFSGTANTPGRF